MRKILLCFMTVAVAMMVFSCQSASDGKCHITGEVKGEQYEGKRIFLVPMYGPKTAEYVDSMEITNGMFSFEKDFSKDTIQMYQILMDYHYRMGLQPILVVGEPGEVKVVIDSVSSAGGTPQNDSLQQWKMRTEMHNLQLAKMRRNVEELKQKGDAVQAKYIEQRADSFHLVYKNYTRQLAKNMKEGVLHDFLMQRFPLTYKRKYPDGRVVTFNADTNEEITQ